MNNYRKDLEHLLQGTGIEIDGENPWDIQVHNNALYKRIFSDGSLGLGEAYMENWWDCERLDLFFERLFKSEIEKKVLGSFKIKWTVVKAKLLNQQTRKKSSVSIKSHYDIGNDLYQKMLDPLLVYSCGYWKNDDNLAQAQERKLDSICQKIDLKPGDKLLDIGCGWGGFAYFAAKNYGAKVVGITISEAQRKKAEEVCKDLPVEIRLQDYRDVSGDFDKIVSVGMLEHVGHKNYQKFMKIVSRNLKDDGLALLRFIGGNETVYTTDPWIDKYIFPHGLVPSIQQIGKAMEENLLLLNWQNFALHYDYTLMAWKKNFDQSWNLLSNQYSESFKRMWNFYLCSSAASFRTRRINLWQLVVSKKNYHKPYEVIRSDGVKIS